MRPVLLDPGGELTDDLLYDVLTLVCDGNVPPMEQLKRWTPLERLLAYDWGMREHLAASDNPIMRRPRPSFLSAP